MPSILESIVIQNTSNEQMVCLMKLLNNFFALVHNPYYDADAKRFRPTLEGTLSPTRIRIKAHTFPLVLGENRIGLAIRALLKDELTRIEKKEEERKLRLETSSRSDSLVRESVTAALQGIGTGTTPTAATVSTNSYTFSTWYRRPPPASVTAGTDMSGNDWSYAVYTGNGNNTVNITMPYSFTIMNPPSMVMVRNSTA